MTGDVTTAVRAHEAQRVGDRRFHLAPIDDEVEHALLEQELAALESLGQLLPDRLLDDARSGEADQRLRLGDVEIAEHREARGHAAGRRIGQHRDEGQPARSSRASAPQILAICISEQRALHHARAAGAADDDHRQSARRWRARWRA